MVQVHSGPLSGVIAQLVERQLCKLDVRSSSLLSSSGAPGRTASARRMLHIEITAVEIIKQSSESDLKHQSRWIRAAHAAEQELNRWKEEIMQESARGGCLGIRRRRRTGQAPKVPCEAQRAFDHGGSEWGNPRASVSSGRIHSPAEANPGN